MYIKNKQLYTHGKWTNRDNVCTLYQLSGPSLTTDHPPSTTSVCPVIWRAPGPTKKRTACAISAGIEGRPMGVNRFLHVTSVVVTHDRDLAFGVADRIAIINEGRILTIGTPDEVKRFNNPLIQKFLHADFKRDPESKPL